MNNYKHNKNNENSIMQLLWKLTDDSFNSPQKTRHHEIQSKEEVVLKSENPSKNLLKAR